MSGRAEEQILPIDIIFSCTICHAILPEIYQTSECDKGFRDGGNGDVPQPVAKLWLTNCGHVICSKHLEGGVLPFHPAGEQPQHICPYCFEESNDRRKKAFYAIRGFKEGEYDPKIHKEWFDVPPMKLSGKNGEISAVTFQYLALVRFGMTMMVEARKTAKLEAKADEQGAQVSNGRETLKNQQEALQARITELEQCERELKPWKDREPKIKFYLNLFPQITRENERLREQLTAMGYAVPKRTYGLRPYDGERVSQDRTPVHPLNHHPADMPPNAYHAPQATEVIPNEHETRAEQWTSSDRTLSGRADPTVHQYGTLGHQPERSNKRYRGEEDHMISGRNRDTTTEVRGVSRDLMPPPPRPMNKLPQWLGRHSAEDNAGFDGAAMQRHPISQPVVEMSPELSDGHFNWQQNRGVDMALPDRAHDLYRRANNHAHLSTPLSRESGRVQLSPKHLHILQGSVDGSGHRFRKNMLADAENFRPQHASPSHSHRTTHAPDQRHVLRQENEMQPRYLDNPPSHEQDQSKLNLQQYRYDGTALSQAESARLRPLGEFARNRVGNEPRTPSPSKRRDMPNTAIFQPQSVISPFFKRSTGMTHTGRVTLSNNAAPNIHMGLGTRASPAQSPRSENTLLQPQKTYIATPTVQRSTTPRVQTLRSSQQRFVTPQISRTRNGLFQRHETSEPPRSPYFQPRMGDPALDQPFIRSTPKSNRTSQRIAALGSSTPSIKSNIYVPQGGRPTFKIDGQQKSGGGQLGVGPFNNYDSGYAREQSKRSISGFDRIHGETGLKSGASRLSNEVARTPGGSMQRQGLDTGGFGRTRRSVRR